MYESNLVHLKKLSLFRSLSLNEPAAAFMPPPFHFSVLFPDFSYQEYNADGNKQDIRKPLEIRRKYMLHNQVVHTDFGAVVGKHDDNTDAKPLAAPAARGVHPD